MIAAVTVRVFLGWRAPRLVSSPSTRLQLVSVWEMLQFLLNAVLFVLVGLQLPGILEGLDRYSTGELLVQAAIVSGVVVALRLLWSFAALRSPGGARDCLCRRGEGRPPYAHVGIVAWSGMRGAVALAAASPSPSPSRAAIRFQAAIS